MQVAEKLELERASVLVHCSDGWDRTAQVSDRKPHRSFAHLSPCSVHDAGGCVTECVCAAGLCDCRSATGSVLPHLKGSGSAGGEGLVFVRTQVP